MTWGRPRSRQAEQAQSARQILFAEGRAADIAAAADFRDERLASAVRTALGPAAVDFALQPSETRVKRLLIADMDSTIVTTETLDEMAGEAGLKDQISAITARAMNGELDFESALRERMSLLAGMDAGVLERTYAGTELSPGAEAMVAGMRKAGAECRLVSGGFKYFTSRIAERLDFNGDQANDIEVLDGKLTGRVLDPILDKHAKLATLRALSLSFRSASMMPLQLAMVPTICQCWRPLALGSHGGRSQASRRAQEPGSTTAISRHCCSSSDWTPASASGMLANHRHRMTVMPANVTKEKLKAGEIGAWRRPSPGANGGHGEDHAGVRVRLAVYRSRT